MSGGEIIMGTYVGNQFSYQPAINYCQSFQNNFNNFGSNFYQQNNTNIYNNCFSAMPIQQAPIIMQVPQVIYQQPQQCGSSNFMMQMISMLLPLLLGGSQCIDSEETIIEEKDLPDFAQVNSPAINANANVKGHGKTNLVNDVKGANNNYVSGDDNRVEFIGDSDPNTFHVGGEDNEVSIYNIGGDDTVYLRGKEKDWEVVDLPQSSKTRASSHYVIFHNKKTDTYVKAASDEGGRGVDWIKRRIAYE